MCKYLEKHQLKKDMKFYLDERLFFRSKINGPNLVESRSDADVCLTTYKGATDRVKQTFKTPYFSIVHNYYDFICDQNEFYPSEKELKKLTKQYFSKDLASHNLASSLILYLNQEKYRNFKDWIFRKRVKSPIAKKSIPYSSEYITLNHISFENLRHTHIPEDKQELYESFLV